MHLRLAHRAGGAGLGDDLAAAHLVAPLDQDLLVIGVGRHPVIGVPDQDEIAVAFELVAGIGHDTVLGGLHRGPLRNRHVDAVIVPAVGSRAELGDDAALHRPAEAVARHGIGRRQLIVAGHAWAVFAGDLRRGGNVGRLLSLLLVGGVAGLAAGLGIGLGIGRSSVLRLLLGQG